MMDDDRKDAGWPHDVPLPFLQWRARLCPYGADLARCISCEHCRGVAYANWPGNICRLYDAAAWRAYCAAFRKAHAAAERMKMEDALWL